MNILVVNKSTVVEDAQVQNWLPAFNVYVDHVCDWWPRSVSLVWCPRDKEPELAWKLVFADTSDEAGALGYHDFTADGRPSPMCSPPMSRRTGRASPSPRRMRSPR